MDNLPHIQLKDSIAARLFRKVFFVYVLIALVVTVLHLLMEYKRVKNDVISELDRSVVTIGKPLGIALWDADSEQLSSLQEGLLANRMIVGLCVIESESECVKPYGNVPIENERQEIVDGDIVTLEGRGHSNGIFGYKYPLRYEESQSPNPLGHLVLFSSEYLIFNMMKYQVIYIIITATIKAIVLWLGFLWFAQRLLTKPLVNLAVKASTVTMDNLSPLDIQTSDKKQSELSALYDAFNTMIDNLERGAQTQKDLYQELSQYKSNLEELVENRTLELLETNKKLQSEIKEREEVEDQLHQSQKMEAIGSLAGGIAHDFNNLLLGVQGRASVALANLEKTDPLYDNLKEIEEYVQKAKSLTQQLLGVARRGRYNPKPVNLNDLVKKSADMFGRTRKDIEVATLSINEDVVVEADNQQLEQVLLNLFLNAAQAMESGGKISLVIADTYLQENVTRLYDRQPGKYGVVKVEDVGCGMGEETLSQIFNPFFTTKEMGRGTGLGLASAYGIIKNHKGFIVAESKLGIGSTFTVYLPSSEHMVKVEEKVIEESIRGEGQVLLIDDEELILDVGGSMITELGYKVTQAKGGEEGVRIYQEAQGAFNLVILDLIMPGMDGVETFHAIRQINPSQSILISSGYAMDIKAEELMKSGAAGFLQKPFGLSELSRQLQETMD